VIPEYGTNVRRSTQAGTDALLDEDADIEAATAPDPTATPAPPPALDPAGEHVGAGPGHTHHDEGHGRWSFLVPLLLAALGLAAAGIAWRVGVASSAADDANRAGIQAARQRAVDVVQIEGETSRSTEAFLDYERDRRRALALTAAGSNDEGLLNFMEAAAHWGSVDSQYLDRNGQFQPAQERAAQLAGDEQNQDIQPLEHFDTADAEYARVSALIVAGIVLILALPFLTLAEIGKGRLRVVSVLAGSGIFVVGVVLAAVAWL
jgi:hypothetical protein